MRWIKLGKVFDVNDLNRQEWMNSHSSNPTALFLKDDCYRVFFSTRNAENKSNVGYFDINLKTNKVYKISNEPILLHGKSNSFDESGIGLGSILPIENQYHVYYMGWQSPANHHWRGDIVKATLSLEFNEIQRELLLGVDQTEDKMSLSYPFLIIEDDVFHMWYGSTETWDYGNGEMLHTIKHAYSIDLKEWTRTGVCIDYQIGKSQAFSRPTVIKHMGEYHMWYSYRGNNDKYKIGYAKSKNKLDWITYHDTVCSLETSKDDWDSEMICYPYVFYHKDRLYMLYNGNGYGKSGIGLAVLEEE